MHSMSVAQEKHMRKTYDMRLQVDEGAKNSLSHSVSHHITLK